MHKHTFPDNYGTDCVLVELDAAMMPLIVGQVEMMLQRRYWLTEDDYIAGKSAAGKVIAAMAGNCTQAIVEAINQSAEATRQVYRLLDTAYNYAYYAVDGAGVVQPPIPAAPINNDDIYNTPNGQALILETRNYIRNVSGGVDFLTGTHSIPDEFGRFGLLDILQALAALNTTIGGQPVPSDYASVLSTIAFNTGLTRANAGSGYQVGARQLCCDSATVEPLPTTNARPSDAIVCQGLQALADGFLDVINALNVYHTKVTYPDANAVLRVANQQLLARNLPQISGTTAQEVATAMYGETRGGAAWNTWYGDGDKATYVGAVYNATQSDIAASLAGQWVDTLAFMPEEIKAIVKPIVSDQSLYNALFDGTIDGSAYDGSICGGSGGGTPATITSVFGAQFDNVTGDIVAGTHHYYAENGSGASYYQAVYSWDISLGIDTKALNRTGEVDDIRGSGLFGYFPNDWVGVQLRIQSGPSDVALHFPPPAEHPDITLSSTEYTTLPSGTSGFVIYSASDDHAPYTPFVLDVIFP